LKCHYHPDEDSISQCGCCEQHLCSQCAIPLDKGFFCSRCVALEAAKEATEGIDLRLEEKRKKAEIRKEKEKIKKVLWHAWQWGIVVIGLCVMAYQVPDLINVLKDRKPLRKGTYNTDEKTDDCVRNLWEVAKLLQQGRLPGEALVCPASKKAFLIAEEKYDIVARTPDPGLYGFKEIRVSKNNPVPELIR
jgi:hypothetical protein